MIGRLLLAGGAVLVPLASFGVIARRGGRRLLAAPRTMPDERGSGPALDALGGEVARLRRDGVLAARWLPSWRPDDDWHVDPHEAILLLHGYSGSIAPDLVEYAPFLRRTAGVLGLDFRGHGDSDDGRRPSGCSRSRTSPEPRLARRAGRTRVALVGASMATSPSRRRPCWATARWPRSTRRPQPRSRRGRRHARRIVAVVGIWWRPRSGPSSPAGSAGRSAASMADGPGRARQLGEDVRTVEPRRMLPLLEDLRSCSSTAAPTTRCPAAGFAWPRGGRRSSTGSPDAGTAVAHATTPGLRGSRDGVPPASPWDRQGVSRILGVRGVTGTSEG
jgi:hypothetical protein